MKEVKIHLIHVLVILMGLMLLSGCHSSIHTNNMEVKLDKEVISSTLKLGMTQDETRKSIKHKYTEILAAMDNAKMWRYDLDAKEGYHYKEDMDFADIDGILNGSLFAQLFVTWTNDLRIESYSILYIGEDGRIHEYRMNDAGEIKDTIIR